MMWKNNNISPRSSISYYYYYYALLIGGQLLCQHCIFNEAFVVHHQKPILSTQPRGRFGLGRTTSSQFQPLQVLDESIDVQTSDPPLASYFAKSSTTTTTTSSSSNSNSTTNDGSSSTSSSSNANSLLSKFTLAETPEDYIDLDVGQRLICVGDVHGDFEALQDFLRIAKVYDVESDSWCGGNTILVQCGDVLDRGSEELKCYELISKLSRQALDDDGKVIVLLGNHEILNAMGLFQYATTDAEYEEVIGAVVDEELKSTNWRIQYVENQPARWATYEPGGLLANSLLANMKVAVQVGKTVCVHAGLTADHIKEYGGLTNMNRQAHDWLAPPPLEKMSSTSTTTTISPLVNVTYNNKGQYDSYSQKYAQAAARQTSYINTAPDFLNGGIGATSPIWMRDYSTPNDMPPKNPMAQKMIDAALKELDHDCDRMVMGHTVQRRINSALGGKAWRVDVGASKGVMGGAPEVLEITKQKDGTEKIQVLARNGRVPARERDVSFYNML